MPAPANRSRPRVGQSPTAGPGWARGARPDLVPVDLQMPRVDGLALLEQIRGLEPPRPVIVIRAP